MFKTHHKLVCTKTFVFADWSSKRHLDRVLLSWIQHPDGSFQVSFSVLAVFLQTLVQHMFYFLICQG